MSQRTVIVATDGTDSSRAAVRWAAGEAQLRGAVLRIAHVIDWEWAEARYDFGGDHFAVARHMAETVARAGAALARDAAPGVTTETDVLVGNPAARLLAESDSAELLVVGSRGRGGFASLLLGSVSQRVAVQASCPVVVVRGRGDVTDGPVVVGYDDSSTADHVLRSAFELASARGCGIDVIRARLPMLGVYPIGAVTVTTPEEDAAERSHLDEQLEPWRGKHPGRPPPRQQMRPVADHTPGGPHQHPPVVRHRGGRPDQRVPGRPDRGGRQPRPPGHRGSAARLDRPATAAPRRLPGLPGPGDGPPGGLTLPKVRPAA
ncbi:universal stress protein [Actinoplanes rectilineatus]|uniref:universal stress protein n=1 Tax=Actinoplanes rectilineatus TaxID=113571 RepID=UPI000AE41A3E|nr:universal stress protein [Actinoplanes rectilineatus]